MKPDRDNLSEMLEVYKAVSSLQAEIEILESLDEEYGQDIRLEMQREADAPKFDAKKPVFLSSEEERDISVPGNQCQGLVRFFALRRIKPHTPPLVRAPVNSFEFQPCGRTPQAGYLLR